MKTVTLAAAMVLTMPTFAFAQDKCYDDAKTQYDLNQCAGTSLGKSDKKLNELYTQIEARLKDDAICQEASRPGTAGLEHIS